MKKNVFFVFAIALMMVIAGVMSTGCEKGFHFVDKNGNDIVVPVPETVGLSATTSSGSGMKIASGQTIYTDSIYYSRFWLTPATGNIVVGMWTIRYPNNTIFYQSVSPENQADTIFPHGGNFSLEVSGTYQGQTFLFNNVTVIVGSAPPPPPPPTIPTSPVRLYNFNVSGGIATVSVAISKAQWQNQSGATWFHVKRVNGLNFLDSLYVSSTIDSVFFSLIFSAINQNYVEFNSGFYDGSVGGVWLIPGYGATPSILYTGAVGVPYGGSENFFGFRFHDAGSGVYELRTHSGTLVLSTSTIAPPPIPGNAGDGAGNNYQVRWSGYYHWFKTNEPNPTLRWKMGPTGTWNYLTPNPVIWSANPNYVTWEFPQLTGQVRWQNGTGTGASFIPDFTGMTNSQYYNTTSNELVVNMK